MRTQRNPRSTGDKASIRSRCAAEDCVVALFLTSTKAGTVSIAVGTYILRANELRNNYNNYSNIVENSRVSSVPVLEAMMDAPALLQ